MIIFFKLSFLKKLNKHDLSPSSFAVDEVRLLKLVENGLSRERLALLIIPMIPINILLPIYIGKLTAGPKPLNIFLRSYPYRLFLGIPFAVTVWITAFCKIVDGSFPSWYVQLWL